MPVVTRTALVAYTPAELFALVSDVAAYPQFLPFCVDARVLAQEADSLLASMEFARAGIRQGVTTRNRLLPPHRLEMDLVAGPFAELAGAWEFQPLGAAASKVIFTIRFDIDSALAHFAAGPFIDQAAALALDAFGKRAVALYGKR